MARKLTTTRVLALAVLATLTAVGSRACADLIGILCDVSDPPIFNCFQEGGSGRYVFNPATQTGTFTVMCSPGASLTADGTPFVRLNNVAGTARITRGANGNIRSGNPDPAQDSNDHDGTTVVLPANHAEDLMIDFIYCSLNPPIECDGEIGNFVWCDLDCDGIQDDDEPGIEGVKVKLFHRVNGRFQMIEILVTDNTGFYKFRGLCKGDYKVKVDRQTLPEDCQESTLRRVGNDPTKDSDGRPDHGFVSVWLDDDQKNSDIDFGYKPRCRGEIGDFVWKDQDGDGLQDDGEAGIEGVKVVLKYGGSVIDEQVTNGQGRYCFTGLCAGDYKADVIERTLPEDCRTPTTPDVGHDDDIDSDGLADGGFIRVWLDDGEKDKSVDFGYK